MMCLENGLIAVHEAIQRSDENEVRFLATPPWPVLMAIKRKLPVQAEAAKRYLIQVAGPTSLKTQERATGESRNAHCRQVDGNLAHGRVGKFGL